MGKVQRYGQDWEYEPSKVIKREEGPYVLYSDYQALERKLAALVGLADAIILSEPMPSGEPAESVWLGRQQLADEIKAAIAAAEGV